LVFLVLDVLGVSIQEVLDFGRHLLNESSNQNLNDEISINMKELKRNLTRWIPNDQQFRDSGRWVINADLWSDLVGEGARTLEGFGEDLTNGQLEDHLRSQRDAKIIRPCTLAIALTNTMGSRRAIALCKRDSIRTFDDLEGLDNYLMEVDHVIMQKGMKEALAMLTKRGGGIKGVSQATASTYLYLRNLSTGNSENIDAIVIMRKEVANLVQHSTPNPHLSTNSYEGFLINIYQLATEFGASPRAIEYGAWKLIQNGITASK